MNTLDIGGCGVSAELSTRWRVKAAELRPYAPPAAQAFEDCARDLDEALRDANEQLLSLEQAAFTTGYSGDHLRRLARNGRLPAVRRGRRLFFRTDQLPRKPAAVDAASGVHYDPIADARRVAARRSKGDESNGTHTAA
jgi:excisionase family DNA binding protein